MCGPAALPGLTVVLTSRQLLYPCLSMFRHQLSLEQSVDKADMSKKLTNFFLACFWTSKKIEEFVFGSKKVWGSPNTSSTI